MKNEILYSVAQVAIVLKVHNLTVRRYIKEGKLRAVKAGGNIRIPQSSLDDFTQELHPTAYGVKDQVKVETPARLDSAERAKFSLDDPIFRLKGRGMSLRGL